jgi:hypothetical protein
MVQDARRLLGWAAEAQAAHPAQAEAVGAAAALLERLLAQDVEEKPEGGCQIKEGTEKDRVVSVADPEMRHGHKSARQRVQLGIRRSRYFGRTKTRLQVVMAAVVANLSLVVGHVKRQAAPAAIPSAEVASAAKTGLLGVLLVIWTRFFTRPEPAWA